MTYPKRTVINGISEDTVTAEIIHNLTTMRNTNNVTSEQVLMWAKGSEATKSSENYPSMCAGKLRQII